MTDHLIECGLYLFKYLRSLQVLSGLAAVLSLHVPCPPSLRPSAPALPST